jgi:fatty acid desaturase
MLVYLTVVAAGIGIRQVDRLRFRARPDEWPRSLAAVLALQRARMNDITPALLLAGEWIEWAGWLGIASRGGPAGWALACGAVAVKMRHLQEISHFAVHGVLTRSTSFGDALAEGVSAAPLGLPPISIRRQRHVRQHHPNATSAVLDPNLADLARAGLRPGAARTRFVLGCMFPLTPAGFTDTLQSIVANMRSGHKWRIALFAALPASTVLAFGWPAAVFGVVVPRLLLYPQLAWLSLLVEHRWFDAEPRDGPAAVVEAGRCIRLYPGSRYRSGIARITWLPYGDLFHYAHSVHPAVRWNHLPALERIIGLPDYTPSGLFGRRTAVLAHHYRAVEDTKAAAPLSARRRRPVRPGRVGARRRFAATARRR